MKNICIIGSTGSIGRQSLDICRLHREELTVKALGAGAGNLALLAQQIEEFHPDLVSVPDQQAASSLQGMLSARTRRLKIVTGPDGLIEVATHGQAQTLVTAIVGFKGLLPTEAAIRQGKTIALANKETLVAAGSLLMPLARLHQAEVVPIDSEHSAIYQSLKGYSTKDIRQILLTGSGGPFRTWSRERIEDATVSDALNHPNWAMGKKITIDSATLMNKGLEVIEARWLFDIDPSAIKVVIHPQSILHSAVEFIDRSVIGQMGLPDMRLPIHYALFHPDRIRSDVVPTLSLFQIGSLTFEEPDQERFPCLKLAQDIASEESTLPCVLNAANEMAVEWFLQGRIKFYDIPRSIERILNRHRPVSRPSLMDILEADSWTRAIFSEQSAALRS